MTLSDVLHNFAFHTSAPESLPKRMPHHISESSIKHAVSRPLPRKVSETFFLCTSCFVPSSSAFFATQTHRHRRTLKTLHTRHTTYESACPCPCRRREVSPTRTEISCGFQGKALHDSQLQHKHERFDVYPKRKTMTFMFCCISSFSTHAHTNFFSRFRFGSSSILPLLVRGQRVHKVTKKVYM